MFNKNREEIPVQCDRCKKTFTLENFSEHSMNHKLRDRLHERTNEISRLTIENANLKAKIDYKPTQAPKDHDRELQLIERAIILAKADDIPLENAYVRIDMLLNPPTCSFVYAIGSMSIHCVLPHGHVGHHKDKNDCEFYQMTDRNN